MKKTMLCLLALCLFAGAVSAQLNTNVKSTFEARKELPVNLFKQLVNSLKTAALSGSAEKTKKTLLFDLSELTDGDKMTKKVQTLYSSVKPSYFKKDFVLPVATLPASMKNAMELLKTLESGLKTEALADNWPFMRNAWTEQIKSIR